MAVRDMKTEWLRVKGYRAMTPQRRLEIAQELTHHGRWVAWNMARRKPERSARQIEFDYWNRIYGRHIAARVQAMRVNPMSEHEQMENIQVVRQAIMILERLEIPYAIVGGFASIFWGRPRVTQDADLLAQIPLQKVEILAQVLGQEFVISQDAIRDAVRLRSEFNAIHQAEVYKVDFWIPATLFDQEVLKRRRRELIAPDMEVFVQSPEDTILSKLRWCKMSGGSERQFHDALGVYEIEYLDLDQNYLDHWARVLDVTDLLERIRAEAALPPEE